VLFMELKSSSSMRSSNAFIRMSCTSNSKQCIMTHCIHYAAFCVIYTVNSYTAATLICNLIIFYTHFCCVTLSLKNTSSANS
jgi:hypothetical protein